MTLKLAQTYTVPEAKEEIQSVIRVFTRISQKFIMKNIFIGIKSREKFVLWVFIKLENIENNVLKSILAVKHSK